MIRPPGPRDPQVDRGAPQRRPSIVLQVALIAPVELQVASRVPRLDLLVAPEVKAHLKHSVPRGTAG